jgi:Putative lumazine-binding
MKYTFLLALTAALMAVATPSRAQTSVEDSVGTVLGTLFKSMKNADTAAIREVFTDGAMLQVVGTGKNGNTSVQTATVDDFLTRISGLGKNAADERININGIKIDGPLALVWAPYSFYLKGSFHHCGLDTFQLIRTAKGWKIQFIMYTGRANSCPTGTPDVP